MEDLFEEELLKNLSHMYSYTNEEDILKIFFLRSMIFNLSDKLDNEEILKFIDRELYLPKGSLINFNDYCIYKNYYGKFNSIESIIDNWKFRILDKSFKSFNNKPITIKEKLIKQYNEYLLLSKKELKGIKKSNPYYKHSLKHIMLLNLYKNYNIEYINECKDIKGLIYDYNNDFINKITIDLEYNRYYDLVYINAKEKEKNLEDFIYYNYNTNNKKLFNRITIKHRQYKVKSGIIDLLGEDDNGDIVIIELKVVKRPIDIFYQIKSYTSNIQKEFKNKKVKFIAITPKLKEDIFEKIQKEDIELYYYNKKLDKYLFNKVI